MYSVLLLIVSFGALAGLYVLLDAPFVAVTQIIIYAGAIMVVFLFVVMLLNVPREEPSPPGLLAATRGRTSAACSPWCWPSSSCGRSRASTRSGSGGRRTAERLSSVSEIGIALFTNTASRSR